MRRASVLVMAMNLTVLAPQATRAQAAAPAGKITSVVVYSDRAQVTRTLWAPCRPGRVEFSGLPSTLDTRSLRVSAGEEAKVLGVTWAERATPYKEQVKDLLRKIKTVDREVVQVKHRMAAADAAQEKLGGFKGQLWRVWGRQAAGAKPPVKTWNAALDLLRGEALAAARQHEALGVRMRAAEQRMARLKAQIRALEKARRRTTLTVSVLLRCRGSVPVGLSYLVPGATWRVAYEARAEAASKKVTLVAQALVRQGTGEDWRGVELWVSTVNLQRSNLPPRIRPLTVRSSESVNEMKVLERRTTTRQRLDMAKNVQLAGTVRRPPGPAVKIRALASASVPADGREVAVTLARATPASRFTLEAVPKLLPLVYHRMTVANPFPFTMLPGQVSIFRDGTFIGRARLAQVAPGEPLALSLGAHNQVRVRRYVKTEKLERGSAFKSRRLVHRYRIQVDNWTRRPRKVVIRENLPVSRVKEIKVHLGADTTTPTSRDANAGLLTWELTIPPRSKKVIDLAYSVSVPKSYHIAGY